VELVGPLLLLLLLLLVVVVLWIRDLKYSTSCRARCDLPDVG
jgi:hypothetical protein